MTRAFYSVALIFVTALLLSACGDTSIGPGGVVTTADDLSYSFNENGCQTGDQSFSSKASLCDGLRNETLNHGCARGLRQRYFVDQGCSGSF